MEFSLLSKLVWFLIPISIFFVWFAWDTFRGSRKKVKVLLWEKVGNVKKWRGVKSASIKKSKLLGLYLRNKDVGLKMQMPDSEDLFPGAKGSNVLAICKYGEDDFRILKLLRNKTFYEERSVQVFETKEVGGELVRVPKLDKDKNLVFVVEKLPFEEPFGITQTARETIRFERAFHKEMDERMKKEPSFWDKYGALLVNGMVIVAFLIFCLFLMRKNIALEDKVLTMQTDGINKFVDELGNPNFIGALVNNFEQSQLEDNVPIT